MKVVTKEWLDEYYLEAFMDGTRAARQNAEEIRAAQLREYPDPLDDSLPPGYGSSNDHWPYT
jgi:hypothetical protein